MFYEETVVAGFGGQGVLALGRLIAYAAMLEGREVSWLPSYGPEMRGGTANCHVIFADEPISCPIIDAPGTLIVLNEPSLDKFEEKVAPGGRVLINSSLVGRSLRRHDLTGHYFPVNQIAIEVGNLKTVNLVMLGAYIGLTGLLKDDSVRKSISRVFGEDKQHFFKINSAALNQGLALAKKQTRKSES